MVSIVSAAVRWTVDSRAAGESNKSRDAAAANEGRRAAQPVDTRPPHIALTPVSAAEKRPEPGPARTGGAPMCDTAPDSAPKDDPRLTPAAAVRGAAPAAPAAAAAPPSLPPLPSNDTRWLPGALLTTPACAFVDDERKRGELLPLPPTTSSTNDTWWGRGTAAFCCCCCCSASPAAAAAAVSLLLVSRLLPRGLTAPTGLPSTLSGRLPVSCWSAASSAARLELLW